MTANNVQVFFYSLGHHAKIQIFSVSCKDRKLSSVQNSKVTDLRTGADKFAGIVLRIFKLSEELLKS